MTYRAAPRTTDHGHPLARAGGTVGVHRAALYAKIGPGVHPCHWCQKSLTWKVVERGQHGGDNLNVDHLDRNTSNNSPDNLVPSCLGCNTARGAAFNAIGDGEITYVRPSGRRERGVELTCDTCQKPFIAPASDSSVKFCSVPCAGVGRRGARASTPAATGPSRVCKKGHLVEGDNAYQSGKYVLCRQCRADASERKRARDKAKRHQSSTPTERS